MSLETQYNRQGHFYNYSGHTIFRSIFQHIDKDFISRYTLIENYSEKSNAGDLYQVYVYKTVIKATSTSHSSRISYFSLYLIINNIPGKINGYINVFDENGCNMNTTLYIRNHIKHIIKEYLTYEDYGMDDSKNEFVFRIASSLERVIKHKSDERIFLEDIYSKVSYTFE